MTQKTDTPTQRTSYIFHRPFNKNAVPFLVTEAAKGHPVVFGNIDNPATILTVDGGGEYPVVFMIPAPENCARPILHANASGVVKDSSLRLFLIDRTITQYMIVQRIGGSLSPGASFYNTEQQAEKAREVSPGVYAIVPVEIPVPWDYPEHLPDEDDREESEHEDS